MTDRNYTCVADAMQSSKKKPPFGVGYTFITNQGCEAKVVKYENKNNVLIEFQDKYKHIKTVRNSEIKNRSVKNPFFKSVYGVGFLGIGDYKSIINGKKTRVYHAWASMLQRCYDPKFIAKKPTYQGCIVCKEWHNFQVFAEWFTSQVNYDKGYQLDKDLLIDGNKIYSPNTCVLAPVEINSLLTDCESARGDYPVGVSLHKKDKKFYSSICIDGKKKHLGSFDTAEQASEAYQTAKKANIKRMALEWQDRIDEKLFNALMAKTA